MVTVTEQAQPNAGTDGTLTVCAGAILTEAELFAQLGGTPDEGGTWTNVDSEYTYTVTAISPCSTDATAIVTVTEQAQPNAGTDGELIVCAGAILTEAELFAQLGGTPDEGGTWTNVDSEYTYTVTAISPCSTDATAIVTVTEQAQPNAGTDGTLTVSAGTTPTEAELFAQLGGTPDEGGTWTNVDSVYTYTVAATSPCTETDTATVTVELEETLGLEDNTIDLKIKVYPNPTSQLLYVSHPEQKNFSIRITDLTGKQMYSGTITAAVPLDIAIYPQGMYLVTVSSKESNQNNTYKILKK
jgi:hypothetical protein